MTATAADNAAGEASRCARCDRLVRDRYERVEGAGEVVLVWIRRWPDGLICSGCFATAMETYGICDGCGTDRLLPGVGPAGQRWCTDCAGGLGDFTCTRCGREGWREHAGICGWCVLQDRVDEILDDGTGRVRIELMPLAALIISMKRPRSGILWLSRPEPRSVLRAIARDEVPLTHEGIHSLPHRRSTVYIRDLMVTAGILPPIDKSLFYFEQWSRSWLDELPDPEQRKMFRLFITWHYLRVFRERIDARGELGYAAPQIARHQLRTAATFVAGLAEQGRTLAEATQADLDRLFAEGTPRLRDTVHPFLRWTMNTRRMPKLELPPPVKRPVALMTQQRRIELIRKVHDGDGMELTDRVLALFVLLYAQPLTRIQQLTIDDIGIDDEGNLLVRLGDPPIPVPAPFADIIRKHVAARRNQTTATNKTSPWLFPGRASGWPLHTTSIRDRLHNLGIPNLSNRSRAIRELLRQAPAIIVAGMLGYSPTGSERIATEYGVTWQQYAAIDRDPRRPPHLID
ncbi:hypothetical protein [Microbacterium saperdae]|nr:hypothetical protein [Microbacterium saperdae]GGM63220.1 hypothetical protein GCM10010489_38390 [Microbacterium saperdae]